MAVATKRSAKKRLICEGWAEEHVSPATGLLIESEDGAEEEVHETAPEVWYPTLGYVTQGEKVLVLFGESNQLDESVAEGRQLIESMDDFDELEEVARGDGSKFKKPKGAKWVVEGPGQRSDVKNANQRTYPRSLWEKLIGDDDSYVQKTIKDRRMFGHLEHPKDGRSDLKEAALITISATLQEDGTVWTAFELTDNAQGRDLQALTAGGLKWGVSSRGTGTVKDNGVVNEADYTLKTWDAVAAPSTPGAFVETQAQPTGKQVESDELAESSTEGAPALSETTRGALSELGTLTESDIDGLGLTERVTLSEQLLRQLSVIVESEDISALLTGGTPAWMTVKNAVAQLRSLHATGSLSIDRAIDEALEHGGEESDEAGWNEIVEALQEQVSTSTEEATELLERLEAAESRFVTLNGQHEEAMEQLSESREELARARAELDLAYELLSEATAPQDGDGCVDVEIVETIVSEIPQLHRFKSLLEQARDETQARELAERLIPVAVPRAPREPEVTHAASRAERPTLPVGLVESLDEGPDYAAQDRASSTSRGAKVAAQVVSHMQKPH